MRSLRLSISKKSQRSKLNIDATMLDGNISMRLPRSAHIGIVETPRGLDAILGVDQLVLQLQEIPVGFELRVALGDREQPAQRDH